MPYAALCSNVKLLPLLTFPVQIRFADIIIKTMDTIRTEYVLDKLLTNQKQVLVIGPTGSGKSLNIGDKLLRGMSSKYVSNFISFSAKTGANQTQDMIDLKMDKRRKGIYGPPLGKQFIIFIDDLNMPAKETYGAQPPIEIIRQWMDHKGLVSGCLTQTSASVPHTNVFTE